MASEETVSDPVVIDSEEDSYWLDFFQVPLGVEDSLISKGSVKTPLFSDGEEMLICLFLKSTAV